jgi:serine/threonine protein kinase
MTLTTRRMNRTRQRRLYSLPRLLQPENIMLRADLAAVIVDFGLARMAPGESSLSHLSY